MSDEQQIRLAYVRMYEAMVAKDTVCLLNLLTSDFVLTHMTGMRQSREEYVQAIADGTLNYFAARHEDLSISVTGSRAKLTGKSRVEAAVFGGGRHTWSLRLNFNLSKDNGKWLFLSARASTY